MVKEIREEEDLDTSLDLRSLSLLRIGYWQIEQTTQGTVRCQIRLFRAFTKRTILLEVVFSVFKLYTIYSFSYHNVNYKKPNPYKGFGFL